MVRTTRIAWRGGNRLIPSRYPAVGLFDRVASADDLDAIFELEGWTNDRISNELGALHMVPREEWITGPMSTVVMAAYCHPRPGGGRFNTDARGAWYAARTVETALAESVYHRTRELEEVGTLDGTMQMRLYRADFRAVFHDIRTGGGAAHAALYDPDDYSASQVWAERLRQDGSNGILYRSVRDPSQSGECLCCFQPRLVTNVRVAGHYEYLWDGTREPRVIRLTQKREYAN